MLLWTPIKIFKNKIFKIKKYKYIFFKLKNYKLII